MMKQMFDPNENENNIHIVSTLKLVWKLYGYYYYCESVHHQKDFNNRYLPVSQTKSYPCVCEYQVFKLQ